MGVVIVGEVLKKIGEKEEKTRRQCLVVVACIWELHT